MKVWIDIDNPPQVQYLLPLVDACRQAGDDVLLTVRDNGITLDLLSNSGVRTVVVGKAFGAARLSKAAGLLRRAASLDRELRRFGGVAAVVSSSRSSALVARLRGIPSFIVCDYEHVSLGLYRIAGSHLLFPDVICPETFRALGFPSERLLPFHGLKEDLSFAGVDWSLQEPHVFPAGLDEIKKVLFRPPAETSHYFDERSKKLADEALDVLAPRADTVVVFSPRYPSQQSYLAGRRWRNEPLLLDRPVAFVPLLLAVDAVVSAGGTMLREAAVLGVPAISLLQNETGAVDRHLESLGRLTFVRSSSDLPVLEAPIQPRSTMLPIRRTLPAELVSLVHTAAASSPAGHRPVIARG